MTERESVAETVHVRAQGSTLWITLDRPPLNIIDIPMMRALDQALSSLPDQNAYVIFRGAGPKGFSAGAEVRDHAPDRVAEMLATFHAIFRRLWHADCVTIAAVHGHCLGGGCELATSCDFVVAAESAQFGQPEIKLGCFPPVAMVMLPRLVGPRAALDLILTGRAIPAREAQQLGLATRVVPDDQLNAEVDALLAELRLRSPAVLGMTRRALWRSTGLDFDRSLREAEELYLNRLMKTEDAQEGICAFLEKRVPVWRGR